MTQVTPFVFEDRPVRIVHRDGEPWFVVADVCSCMGIGNSTMAVANLDDDERSALSLTETSLNGVEQAREFIIISESGLYALILRSRKAVTPGTVQHRFRRWVTSEVLPSIRKTGGYDKAPTKAEPLPVNPGTCNITIPFERYVILTDNLFGALDELRRLNAEISEYKDKGQLRFVVATDILIRDTSLSDEEIAERLVNLFGGNVGKGWVAARRLRQSLLSETGEAGPYRSWH